MALKIAKRKARPKLLYHWSPRERRGQILREGIKLGQKCVTHSCDFPKRAICCCDDPARAWRLSAGALGHHGDLWDLYLIYLRAEDRGKWQPHYEGSIPEYRIYNDIPKNRVLWIGERKIGWNPQK